MEAAAVAEIQGLYGPITVSEILLQKIWLRQEIADEGMRTLEGLPLRVRHPGSWNRLGGPDFLGAELELGEQGVRGDVEIHFYARDWRAHGHDRNPEFSGVVLHVVLFPPSDEETPAERLDGKRMPTLVMLPLLRHDLESYASEEWEQSSRDQLERAEAWLALPVEKRVLRLQELSRRRWEQKLRFARDRVGRCGVEEALHRGCLEVLGYRRNRTPMGNLAEMMPLRVMSRARHSPDHLLSRVGGWRMGGLRPANHPRRRLRQYAQLLGVREQWPRDLLTFSATLVPLPKSPGELSVRAVRRNFGLLPWLEMARREPLAGVFRGSRYWTLWCDAFWPLLSVQLGKSHFGSWYFSPPGDYPLAMVRFLRQIHLLGPGLPPCPNGLYQGALQHFLECGY